MKFSKMHGLGNDFILFESSEPEKDYSREAIRLCHRQTGIGADGIIAILPSDKADIRMRIINCDGSEAEMCGNGIRCMAKYIYEKGLIRRDTFSIETPGGIMRPRLLIERGKVTQVKVNMGEPKLDRKLIPMEGPGGMVVDEPLIIDGQTWRITSMCMTIPHTVTFVPQVKEDIVKTIGPKIETHEKFPRKTNISFVQVIDERTIRARTWERGAGATLACGTGACACAVASFLNGKTERSVQVKLLLGDLFIEYTKDGTVYMTGPAEEAFTGETELA
jgi:diaminopimelate epimerase